MFVADFQNVCAHGCPAAPKKDLIGTVGVRTGAVKGWDQRQNNAKFRLWVSTCVVRVDLRPSYPWVAKCRKRQGGAQGG